jgi:excisionase family DNA binding protein
MEKLTFEQLPEAVALLLEKVNRIESLLENQYSIKEQGQKQVAVKEILTINALASFLDISKSTIYKKVMDREIPFYKLGSKLYFKKEEILEWAFRNRGKTMDEIKQEAITHLANSANKKRRF